MFCRSTITRNQSIHKFVTVRLSPRGKIVTLAVLLRCVLLAIYEVADLAKSSARTSKPGITVQAAGRGRPYLNFQDGRRMLVDYRGEENVIQALRSDQARPRGLVSADLDSNGTPDLIVGYAWSGGGIVTVQRGNPDAFAPADESVYVRMQQGYNPDSLLPTAETYRVPEPVDFLQAGDFNNDNLKDVLVATRGGDLFLLAGDGYGGLKSPEQIALPGSITTVTTGEFRAFDGKLDIAVGVNGPSGAALLIYDGAEGGLKATPTQLALPGEATAATFGEFDGDPFRDLAVAVGSEIEIIHGWGRKTEVSLRSRVEIIDAGASVRDLSTGFYIWNREVKQQLATLSDDGTVRILQRGSQSEQPYSEQENDLRAQAREHPKLNPPGFDIEKFPGWQPSRSEGWTTSRE